MQLILLWLFCLVLKLVIFSVDLPDHRDFWVGTVRNIVVEIIEGHSHTKNFECWNPEVAPLCSMEFNSKADSAGHLPFSHL